MISIILPVYNAEKYLKECIDSLLKQSYTDFEIIIVNDGSSDGSGTICEEYVNKDSRIRYLFQNNAGVSVARNAALDVAKGEYVIFVDSDDVVAPDYLKMLLDLSGDGEFAICGYTRGKEYLGLCEASRKHYDIKTFILQIFSESITHPNIWMMLFKNDIIQNNNLRFTPRCVRNEDTEFYIKYMTFERGVLVSDYKGYYYRDTPNSAVHKFNEKSLTYIEADQRISDYLVGKGIVDKDNLIVDASVQYFVYQTARQKNQKIYDLLHQLYDVKNSMKSMLHHKRLSRKGVAFVYLLLGERLFFKILSLV